MSPRERLLIELEAERYRPVPPPEPHTSEAAAARAAVLQRLIADRRRSR